MKDSYQEKYRILGEVVNIINLHKERENIGVS